MDSPFRGFERLRLEGRVKFIKIDSKIFVYDIRNSYLTEIPFSSEVEKEAVQTTNPPVKTLILHTTYECNLACKHCYINAGSQKREEMDSAELSRIVREFGEMGGLGVDLSGGEAFLKQGIEDVIMTAREQKLRTVVLSNGVSINPKLLTKVSSYLDGIAIGLDGLDGANDSIRGQDSFRRTLTGLESIANAGIELSLTTLITPESIPQLSLFPKFISRYGGKSWSLVMPRQSGRFAGEENQINQIYVLWEEAKRGGILQRLKEQSEKTGVTIILDHILVPGAKKKVEETSKDFVYQIYNKGRACWDNTLTIMPNGDVKCCLFFDGQVYDNVRDKPLREVYGSSRRLKALEEFRKYPVDKCPFIEKHQIRAFEKTLG